MVLTGRIPFLVATCAINAPAFSGSMPFCSSRSIPATERAIRPAVNIVPFRVLFPRGGEARADIARLDTADLNAEGLDLIGKRHGVGVDGGLAG